MCERNDFDGLRVGILVNRRRRVVTAICSVVFVTVMLCWFLIHSSQWAEKFISCVLLMFLSFACLLTLFLGRAEVRAATYIEVFGAGDGGESDWDARSRKFDADCSKWGLNIVLGLVYVGLGVFSLVVPGEIGMDASGLLIWMIIVLVFSLACLFFLSNPGDRYVQRWQAIEEE